jgi:hypothetical protein
VRPYSRRACHRSSVIDAKPLALIGEALDDADDRLKL